MTRIHGSLALAAGSNATSRENRLTEIYAVALEAHRAFADGVFGLAKLDHAPEYEAYVQETLRDGTGRLDLRVYGVTSTEPKKRRVLAVLYGEHKEPRGKLAADQPEKYLPELKLEIRQHSVDGRLLLVLGAPTDMEAHLPGQAQLQARKASSRAAAEEARSKPRRSHLVITKTWHDIATCAERSGRQAFADAHPEHPDPRLWREEAGTPDGPASQRVLLELLTYLEMEGYAVTNGLTAGQIEHAAEALETENTLGALLDESVTKLVAGKVAGFALAWIIGGAFVH